MSDSTVPLSDVLHVLSSHKHLKVVAVDMAIHRYIVSGNGRTEEVTFTDPVGKRAIRRLSINYNVAIHLFWNPAMVQLRPEDQVN